MVYLVKILCNVVFLKKSIIIVKLKLLVENPEEGIRELIL